MKGDINNINNTAESSNDFYTLYFEMENMKKLITLTDYQRNLSFDDPHKLIQCDTLAEFIREKLSCLNSIGITHQDINTNNIMISRDGKQIAIIDFGEAILNDPAATDPADKKYTCDNIIGEITDNTSSRWGGIKNRKTKKLKNEN
jgi:serine/threonine protein kinase